MQLHPRVATALDHLDRRWHADRLRGLGYPGSCSEDDYAPLDAFASRLFNNVADPWSAPDAGQQTKALEVAALGTLAGLFGAGEQWWGYTTPGSKVAILHGLLEGRARIQAAGLEPVVVTSTAAHYSVRGNARDVLQLPTLEVATEMDGSMRLDHLEDTLRRIRQRRSWAGRRRCAPLIVATVGTTVTEACDPVEHIRDRAQHLFDDAYYLHVDAALSGLPLALASSTVDGPRFGLDVAHSLNLSGHKGVLGAPSPYGVYLSTGRHHRAGHPDEPYVKSVDSTVTGSRSGHAPLMLWYALNQWGLTGLAERAHHCWRRAQQAEDALREMGWPCWRGRDRMTVVFTPPSPRTRDMFGLTAAPTPAGPLSHVVTTPDVTVDDIFEFADVMRAEHRPTRAKTFASLVA